MPRENGKIHYGIWVFVLCFAFQFFVVTLQYHAPGQFVAPMAEEMGLSRSAIMSSLSIGAVASMVSMLFAGYLFKKFNMKLLFCIFMTIFSALYLIQSYATTLTQVYAIAIVRGLISPFCSMYPLSIVLNNWYGKRMIGKMVSYAMIGNSIGSLAMNPIIGHLIKNFGWRTCYRVIAFWPLVIVPFIAIFLVVSPDKKGLKPIGEVSEEEEKKAVDTVGEGIPAKAAIRTSGFWVSSLMFLLWCGATQAWILVGPSFLGDAGRDPVGVAAVLSVSAFGNLLGKLVLAYLYGKSSRNGLAFGYGVGLLAFLLAIASSWVGFLAFAASFLFGFCIATVGATPSLMTAELFGRKDYGVISGFMQIGGSIGSSTIPLLTTVVYSLVGSYLTVWGLMAAVTGISILLLFTAFRMKDKMHRQNEEVEHHV